VFNGEVFVGTYCQQDARPYFIRGGVCDTPQLPVNTTSSEALQVCAGSSTTLQVSGTSVQWYDASEGGNLLSAGNDFSIPFIIESTSYFVASRVCDTESERLEITVDVLPIPEALVIENGGTLIALPEEATYQWIFCDGDAIEGAVLQEYLVESPGSYAVVSNVSGCSDTSTCVDVLITSLESDNDYRTLRIFPNPAKDQIFIDSQEIQSWLLFDLMGRAVGAGNSSVLNRGDLPGGLYLLIVTKQKGEPEARPVLFQ
jgi:hypothetical protein